MKKSKILLTTMLTFVALGTMSTLSNATLQSNSRTNYKTATGAGWIISVRDMEAKNGGMGLNEVVNRTTGLPETTSNGIDVHLQKNTEYGAAILLGASDYGKQGAVGGTGTNRYMNTSSGGFSATTTGNVTGIYQLGGTIANNYWEYTAGGLKKYAYENIASRYIDNYADGNEKVGDATKLTAGWHGSSDSQWIQSGYPFFIRGRNGVFNYYYNRYATNEVFAARACVVSAPGI